MSQDRQQHVPQRARGSPGLTREASLAITASQSMPLAGGCLQQHKPLAACSLRHMLHKVSPLRVSVRPDFDALDVVIDESAPARTEDGRPWVRWAKYGSYSGWHAVGARKPKLVGRPTFWEAVYSVACACAGGNVDQAHCCGRGVLALGGLGVTLRSGYAQLLLHSCLVSHPARFIEVMAPVLHATGVFTKVSQKSPAGIALCDSLGHLLLTEEDMRGVITLWSDGATWTNAQKKRAKLWVSCCSELLRDEAMDKAQQAFAEEVMPSLLTATTKDAVKWPRRGPRDSWQYTHEQQMLWALVLVLALEDEHQTETLVCAARDRAHRSEEFSAESVLRNMLREVQDPNYEHMFRERCLQATKLLSGLMGVTL